MKPPIQKFIVFFLLASTIASSVLLASSFYEQPSRSALESTSPSKGPFLENLPSGSTDAEIALLEAQQNNRTENLANLLAADIAKVNPDGPLDQNGNPSILIPSSTEQIIANYIDANPVTNISLEPRIDDSKIKILKNASAQDETHYLAQIGEISSNVYSILQTAPDSENPADWLLTAKNSLDNNIADLQKIEVPARLLDFHKSILGVLLVPANYLTLTGVDPLSAVGLQKDFERQIAEQSMLLDKALADKSLSEGALLAPQSVSLIRELFGVPTAHATLPTIDYVHIGVSIKDFVMKLAEIAQDVAIGYLKNTLLRMMEQQVLVWVAGGPKPQFVADWNGFMEKTVNDAAGMVISRAAPQLCGGAGSIGALVGLGNVAEFIRQVLSPVDQGGYAGQYIGACTLQNVVQNIEDFQRDLRNGGWLAYSAMFEPQNTLFGSLIVLHDSQLEESSKQSQAEAANAQGGGGFVGQKVCDDGQAPLEIDKKKIGRGADGYATVVVIPAGTCEDGSSPVIPTPGRVVGDLVSKSLGGTSDRITSATDWKGLVGALAEAAMTRLTAQATKGLIGLIVKKPKPGEPLVPEVADPDVTKQAQQILDQKKRTLDYMRRVATAADGTAGILRNTVSSCADVTVVESAKIALAGVTAMSDDISSKIEKLKPQVEALEQFVQDIPTKKYSTAQLNAKFGTYEAAQREAYTFAQNPDGTDKLTAIQDLYISATNVFTSSCQGDPALPTDTSNGDTSTSTLP